jgi:hypothetical protein
MCSTRSRPRPPAPDPIDVFLADFLPEVKKVLAPEGE